MPDEKEDAYKLKQVYAFLTLDDQGGEGVVALVTPNGQVQPLISFDEETVGKMKVIAQQMANERGDDIHLVKFTTREDLEKIEANRVRLASILDLPKKV